MGSAEGATSSSCQHSRSSVRFPRWAHHLYALVTGYGWFMCPCGQEFGGHEATGEEVVRYNGDRFAICPTCTVRRYRQQGSWGAGEVLEGRE